MKMTDTFIELARAAAEKLNEGTLHVELEGMGDYYVTRQQSLPSSAHKITTLEDANGTFTLYLVDDQSPDDT